MNTGLHRAKVDVVDKANHKSASRESLEFCELLVTDMSARLPIGALRVAHTRSTCNLEVHVGDQERAVAYVYHTKVKHQITVWPTGDLGDLAARATEYGVPFRPRTPGTKQGASSPGRFTLTSQEQIPAAAAFLVARATTISSSTSSNAEFPALNSVADELVREGAFDPTNSEEARRWNLRAIATRQGQPQFRAALLEAYGGRCAVTGCDAAPALEAAHIKPYAGVVTNSIKNGILLRADIHTLFDLALIAIDPKCGLVRVSTELRRTVYWEFDGKQVREPHEPTASPSRDALEVRWNAFVRCSGPPERDT